MDPNVTLGRIREILEAYDREEDEVSHHLGNELVDLVEGLDHWLSGGGFLPAPWAKWYSLSQ